MPGHWSGVTLVDLETAGTDISSPSTFVTNAEAIDGVEEAFRTSGRYDAVAVVHPTDEMEDALASTQAIANEVRALSGVADVDSLLRRPSNPHEHS